MSLPSAPIAAPRTFSRARRASLVLLCGASMLLAAPARAEGPSSKEELSARKLYDDANVDYALGHYEDALKKFELAFRAKQVPTLLFNIAQCHRQMRNFEQAATTYRSFLRMAPTNSAVPLAKQLLKQVEETIASQNHSQRAGPMAPRRPRSRRTRSSPPLRSSRRGAPTSSPRRRTCRPSRARRCRSR